jgi:hypothetical protein
MGSERERVATRLLSAALQRIPSRLIPSHNNELSGAGHASSLVELDGIRILIDPIWDERASPTTRARPANRYHQRRRARSEMVEIRGMKGRQAQQIFIRIARASALRFLHAD